MISELADRGFSSTVTLVPNAPTSRIFFTLLWWLSGFLLSDFLACVYFSQNPVFSLMTLMLLHSPCHSEGLCPWSPPPAHL